MGHEYRGTIEGVGAEVTTIKPGRLRHRLLLRLREHLPGLPGQSASLYLLRDSLPGISRV
jgi:hypothetical protein